MLGTGKVWCSFGDFCLLPIELMQILNHLYKNHHKLNHKSLLLRICVLACILFLINLMVVTLYIKAHFQHNLQLKTLCFYSLLTLKLIIKRQAASNSKSYPCYYVNHNLIKYQMIQSYVY